MSKMEEEKAIFNSLVLDLAVPLEHVEATFETDLQNVSKLVCFSLK